MVMWKLALAPVRQHRWRFASALPSSHAKWDWTLLKVTLNVAWIWRCGSDNGRRN